MTHEMWLQLLVFLGGLIGIFAFTIYWGLKVRNKRQEQNRNFKASDLRAGIDTISSSPDDFLYTVLQDFSNTSTGYIVRDCHDKDVARISYNMGHITIDSIEGKFDIDHLTWSRQIHLRAHDQLLCTRRSPIFSRHVYYDTPNGGNIDIDKRNVFKMVFPLTKDGQPCGQLRSIDGRTNQGFILLLSHTIPLPIRLFILAFK